ncbi:peptidoglycan-binding protein [Bacillus sp. FJAT-27225]|uniref:cell wall hydrolase n=1 Tax=Bacillus sp. FJAT-27225 TaxID=1743144 RepID=UPI00080C35B6|nr:cell wall hydrolase [Bacillus sp. FJAT-27225]OCA90549.1 peptidoglycan-binding protein [Bacillus sp. FJAT-27225]
MNKLTKLVIAAGLILSISAFTNTASANAATTHQVKQGDSYWEIATRFGVPVKKLMDVNKATSSDLHIGKTLTIPNSIITAAEKDLLARLVHAEAKGEPYSGKVAVATVVLNRVASPDFPDTIKDVIHEVANGYYAFSPVQDGSINKPADAEAKRAVNEALAFQGQGNGSLFFFNPKTAVSKWVFSRETTITIGNHRFAK